MSITLSNKILSLTSTYQTIKTCSNVEGEFVKLLFASVSLTSTSKIYLRMHDDSAGTDVEILTNIPIESEQGQEVIVPIILEENDYLEVKVDNVSMDNNCTCTASILSPSVFFNVNLKNKSRVLSDSYQTIHTSMAGYSTLIKLFLVNQDSDYSKYSIQIYDDSTATTTVIADGMLLDPNTTEIIDFPFILEENDYIQVKKLDAVTNVSLFASIEEKRN